MESGQEYPAGRSDDEFNHAKGIGMMPCKHPRPPLVETMETSKRAGCCAEYSSPIGQQSIDEYADRMKGQRSPQSSSPLEVHVRPDR